MLEVERRREPRRRHDITAQMRFGDRRCNGRVVDLSHTGICLAISPYSQLQENEEVDIYSDGFGLLQGRTVWRTTDRVGIALYESSNTTAKLASYFKLLDAESR